MSLSKRQSLYCILAFLAGSVACELLFAEDQVKWAPDLATASQEAARSQKLLMLHFYADDCPPCRRLDKNVFSQATFAYNLAADYVPVKINASTAPQIAAHFDVKSWPTDIILTPGGDELTRMTSIQDPTQYSSTLRQLVWRHRATDRGNGAASTTVAQFPIKPPKTTMPIERPMMGTAEDTLQNPKTAYGLQPPPNRYASAMGAQSQTSAAGANTFNSNQWPPAATSGAQIATANLTPQAKTTPDATSNLPANRFAAHSTYTASPIPAAATGSNVRQASAQETLTVSEPRPIAPATVLHRDDSQLIMNEFANGEPKAQPTPAVTPTPTQMAVPMSQPPLQLQAPASTVAASRAPENTTGLTATMPPAASQPTLAASNVASGLQPTMTNNAGNATAATYQPSTPSLGSTASNPAAYARAIPPSQPSLAMDGYCPVTLAEENQWIKGDRKWGARHRGRVFLFHSLTAQQQFLADPEKYSPILVGYDPVSLTKSGVYEEGKREHGIRYKDQIVMFNSEVALEEFSGAPQQYMQAVYQVMQQPQTLLR